MSRVLNGIPIQKTHLTTEELQKALNSEEYLTKADRIILQKIMHTSIVVYIMGIILL